MAGAGVLKGFLTLAVTMGWLADTSGVYLVLFSIADGLFTFLPIMLAFTAAKNSILIPFSGCFGDGLGSSQHYCFSRQNN